MTMFVYSRLGSAVAPALIAACFAMGGTAIAQPMPQSFDRRDQDAALQARRQGAMSVREIERRVVPAMRDAQYLGFDYDPGTDVYTLKFLRDGVVIWVDVNARSGQVVRRVGR